MAGHSEKNWCRNTRKRQEPPGRRMGRELGKLKRVRSRTVQSPGPVWASLFPLDCRGLLLFACPASEIYERLKTAFCLPNFSSELQTGFFHSLVARVHPARPESRETLACVSGRWYFHQKAQPLIF